MTLTENTNKLLEGCGTICGNSIYKDMNPRPCGNTVDGELRFCSDCRARIQERLKVLNEIHPFLEDLDLDNAVSLNKDYNFRFKEMVEEISSNIEKLKEGLK